LLKGQILRNTTWTLYAGGVDFVLLSLPAACQLGLFSPTQGVVTYNSFGSIGYAASTVFPINAGIIEIDFELPIYDASGIDANAGIIYLDTISFYPGISESCPSGSNLCHGECLTVASFQTDSDNCGWCYDVCNGTVCGTGCQAGMICCSGQCTATNPCPTSPPPTTPPTPPPTVPPTLPPTVPPTGGPTTCISVPEGPGSGIGVASGWCCPGQSFTATSGTLVSVTFWMTITRSLSAQVNLLNNWGGSAIESTAALSLSSGYGYYTFPFSPSVRTQVGTTYILQPVNNNVDGADDDGITLDLEGGGYSHGAAGANCNSIGVGGCGVSGDFAFSVTCE